MAILQKIHLSGGMFQDGAGNPNSNGYLILTLSHDSNVQVLGGPTGVQVYAGVPIKVRLDNNGNILPNQIWPNSLLTPSGSYYLAKLYNNSGLEIWSAPQQWALNISSGDAGTIVPEIPED